MKNEKNILLSTLGVTLCLILVKANLMASDYLVQSLGSIVQKSSAIIEGTVIDVQVGLDEHNITVETITIFIEDVIAGEISEDIISLRLTRLPDEDKNHPIFPYFLSNERVILHLYKFWGHHT